MTTTRFAHYSHRLSETLVPYEINYSKLSKRFQINQKFLKNEIETN